MANGNTIDMTIVGDSISTPNPGYLNPLTAALAPYGVTTHRAVGIGPHDMLNISNYYAQWIGAFPQSTVLTLNSTIHDVLRYGSDQGAPEVTPTNYTIAIERILDKVVLDGIINTVLLVLGTPVNSTSYPGNVFVSNTDIEIYNQLAIDSFNKTKYASLKRHIVDLYTYSKTVVVPAHGWNADNIHWTPEGAAMQGEYIAKAVRQVLDLDPLVYALGTQQEFNALPLLPTADTIYGELHRASAIQMHAGWSVEFTAIKFKEEVYPTQYRGLTYGGTVTAMNTICDTGSFIGLWVATNTEIFPNPCQTKTTFQQIIVRATGDTTLTTVLGWLLGSAMYARVVTEAIIIKDASGNIVEKLYGEISDFGNIPTRWSSPGLFTYGKSGISGNFTDVQTLLSSVANPEKPVIVEVLNNTINTSSIPSIINGRAVTVQHTYVAAIAVTGVTLNKSTDTLSRGSSADTLIATVAPTNANNKTVTWSTSNASVATVSSSGIVTPVATGNATITATTQDGNFTAACAVTVIAPIPSAPTITSPINGATGVSLSNNIQWSIVAGEGVIDCEVEISDTADFSGNVKRYSNITGTTLGPIGDKI